MTFKETGCQEKIQNLDENRTKSDDGDLDVEEPSQVKGPKDLTKVEKESYPFVNEV